MSNTSDEDYKIRKDALNAACVATSDGVSSYTLLLYTEQLRKYLEYGTIR